MCEDKMRDDAPTLDDTILEKNRKTTWMTIPCPRCRSCFTPLSLVVDSKKTYPLFPAVAPKRTTLAKYFVEMKYEEVDEGTRCVLCCADVKYPSPSLVSKSDTIVYFFECNRGYAHLECAHVQIQLNGECVCGKRHDDATGYAETTHDD